MASQPIYKYERDDGTILYGLTMEQALEEEKKDKEQQQQQQMDAKLGPQIAAGIHAYEAQNQQQTSKGPQQPFQTMGNTSSSPMSGMSSTGPSQNTSPAPNVTVSRFGEDGFMEMVNGAVEQQKRETPSPFEGTPAFDSLSNNASSQSPMSAMQDTSWRPAPSAQEQRASADFLALTEGIPPEILRQLNARFRMGDLTPTQYQKELIKANEDIRQFKSKKEEENYKSQIRKDEEKNRAFFNTEDKILELDSQERRNQANIASQERMNREDNATLLENGKNKGNAREDRILGQIDKTLRNDYIVKQRTEQLQYAGNTVDMLMSDNPVANQAARTQLARLAGEVGVLTDADIKRFGGNQSVLSRAKQAAENAMSGKLTDDNKMLLVTMAKRFKENSEKSLNERLNELALGQSEAFEVPIERITPLVQAYGVNNKQDSGLGNAGSTGSGTSANKYLEEIRARRAAVQNGR